MVVCLGDLGRDLAQRHVPIGPGAGILFLQIGHRDPQDGIEPGKQGPLVLDLARDNADFYQFPLHGKATAIAIVDVSARWGPGGHADKGLLAQLRKDQRRRPVHTPAPFLEIQRHLVLHAKITDE